MQCWGSATGLCQTKTDDRVHTLAWTGEVSINAAISWRVTLIEIKRIETDTSKVHFSYLSVLLSVYSSVWWCWWFSCSVGAHVSVCVCVWENALSGLAEHEHLSDKTAQSRYSQCSHSSHLGRWRGLENIFTGGWGWTEVCANVSYDVI